MPYSKDHLVFQGRWAHYRRRVPRDLIDVVGKTEVKIALKTDSLVDAKLKSVNLNQEVEAYWAALRTGRSSTERNNAESRYQSAVQVATSLGFEFKLAKQLAHEETLEGLVQRIEAADKGGPKTAPALLGGVERPLYSLEDAFEKFEVLTRTDRRDFSEVQLRRWRNPRRLALRNFGTVIGKRQLHEITRDDVLLFRDWWQNRIEEEGLTGNAANKDLGHLSKTFRFVNDALKLGLENPFAGLSLKQTSHETRLPFEASWICDKILAPGVLMQLNSEARWVLLIKIETGARNREICGLDPDNGDIQVDCDVPHICIRPNKFRALKVDHTKREIPLVGVALDAARNLPRGTERYREKADTLSNVVNKFLRENGLIPSSRHTLNSLRHSFEDRLTEVEPPDKLQAALMGHKYHRPRYGSGPSLRQKKEWLEKIALPLDGCLFF